MGADKRKEQSLPYQDSRWSWIMSLVCCWCFFWALIINRCGGIVFVTMISEMGASRELASWPFSLLGTVSKLVGLVWGALVKCFPVRTVAIAGSVLAASGILFCVVFYNVTAMIIGLGVITALGQGLMFPSLLVVMSTYFKRRHVMAASFLVLSASFVSLVYSRSLVMLGTTSLIFGMASGSTIILFTVLLVEYFGLEKLPMTLGSISLVIGLATLPRPLLIGHYRDRGKSYESLYVLLAAMSFGTCIVWVIECIRQWIAGRKSNKTENIEVEQATILT